MKLLVLEMMHFPCCDLSRSGSQVLLAVNTCYYVHLRGTIIAQADSFVAFHLKVDQFDMHFM